MDGGTLILRTHKPNFRMDRPLLKFEKVFSTTEIRKYNFIDWSIECPSLSLIIRKYTAMQQVGKYNMTTVETVFFKTSHELINNLDICIHIY